MINPNKTYRTKEIGEVISVDNSYGYWFKVILDNQTFEGFLREGEPNFEKLSVGDKIRCGAEFSITGQCWLIRNVRKIRK